MWSRGSSGQGRQGRPGKPGAPLPESLSQPSALVPSHPKVPGDSGEGSDPTSLSPPGQASASLCPAHGEGTAPASLLFPSSTFQAQVPRAEPPQSPSRGVCPCCPGFSLQIVPLPLAVPPRSVKASLSSSPSSGPAEGPWVTGSCPQSTLCFPRAPGVTHDGEGVGQDLAVAPWGGRSALWGPHRLAALLPGFWPKKLRGKERGSTLAGGTHLGSDAGGRWSGGCRGPALPEAGVGPRMRVAGLPLHLSRTAGRELVGVLVLSSGGPVGGAAKSVSCPPPARPGSCVQSLSCARGGTTLPPPHEPLLCSTGLTHGSIQCLTPPRGHEGNPTSLLPVNRAVGSCLRLNSRCDVQS